MAFLQQFHLCCLLRFIITLSGHGAFNFPLLSIKHWHARTFARKVDRKVLILELLKMFEKVSVMEPEKLSCEKKHLYTKPSKPNDAIDRMKNERAAVGLW